MYNFVKHYIDMVEKRDAEPLVFFVRTLIPGETTDHAGMIKKRRWNNPEEDRELNQIISEIYKAMLYVERTLRTYHKDDIKILIFGIWKYNKEFYKRMKKNMECIFNTGGCSAIEDIMVELINDLITNGLRTNEKIDPEYPSWLKDFNQLDADYNSSARTPYFMLQRLG